jgi:assimilatory nitrate reductase catalytic subunit
LTLPGLSARDYASLAPFQWPRPRGAAPSETRFFADGRFYHPDRKARFIPTPFRHPSTAPSVRRLLTLNTGRIRDQWHTMTRSAKSARLMAHVCEPFVEIHPADSEAVGVNAADLALVDSEKGRAVLRVVVTERQRRGSLFAPMHWTDQFASNARVDALIASATDPISGQPELKNTSVAVRRFAASWHGFAASVRRVATEGADYFALAPAKGGWRVELAGMSAPGDWTEFARRTLALESGDDLLGYRDEASGRHRFAAFRQDRFCGALFVERGPVAAARVWIADLLGQNIAPAERLPLLLGRPGSESRDRGPIVCACFDVGRNEIVEAVASGKSRTVADIGARLGAGTNCGSCRGEINRLIDGANACRKAGSRFV